MNTKRRLKDSSLYLDFLIGSPIQRILKVLWKTRSVRCLVALDMCYVMGLDISQAVERKMEYNKTRPHRHGGKTI